MKKDVKYYLWLQTALGPGASNTGLIFETYSSAKEIYEESDIERRLSGCFTAKQISSMSNCKLEDTEDILLMCKKNGVDIVTLRDEEYPKRLLELSDLPILLYVKGDLSVLNEKLPIAIVGTRFPTDKSRKVAMELGKSLSKSGFLIVSGGAVGIDTAGHTGALLAGENTICVLGTGILFPYLHENKILRDFITKHGAVVSEFHPMFKGLKWSFPVRNRLISGMSEGVVVVEGKTTSGSINTASHAGEQGRDVFAIKSEGLDSSFTGCDDLIANGARAVTCPLDIVSEYLIRYPENIEIKEDADLLVNLISFGKDSTDFEIKKDILKKDITECLSENTKRVYAVFGSNPLSIKELEKELTMPCSTLVGALTELELYGYVEFLKCTKYVIK